MGDAIEAKAVKRVFGDHSKNLFVSSTKGAHGHLLGAAGNLESIFAVKSVATGMVPPTLNLTNVTEDMDLNFVPNKAAVWKNSGRKIALKNSFGFAGTNATLVFAEYMNDEKVVETQEKTDALSYKESILGPSEFLNNFSPTNFEPTKKHFLLVDVEN